MKCNRCNKERTSLIGGVCFGCFYPKSNDEVIKALTEIMNSEKFSMDDKVTNIGKQMTMNLLNIPPNNLKVQFFEGKLIDIQRQMNSFFGIEKIVKDRLVEIRIIKTRGPETSIMVVYS